MFGKSWSGSGEIRFDKGKINISTHRTSDAPELPMSGKGKIDISIQKFNYAPGDTISGNIALTLKKPVKAREVSISLIGEQWITSREKESGLGITGGGIGLSSSSSSQVERAHIYDFKQQLDSEREYSEGREYYFFEMKVPADIMGGTPQTPEVQVKLGQVQKVIQTAKAMTGAIPSSPIKWYLLAKLDIPRGLDIRKKVDITIG